MIDLLFASNNRGKYNELIDDFAKEGINLIFDGTIDLGEEDGATLKDNAEKKALIGARVKNMYSIGEDTGFFIRSLDYFPGIHANRWHNGTWPEKRAKVLEMMEGETDRTSYLINNFALANPEGEIIYNDKVKNTYDLATEEHSNSETATFGYNTLLIMNGHYIGDLSEEERNFIKHRGRLAKEIKRVILNEIGHPKQQRLF